MNTLAIVGYLVILVMMVMILKNKALPLFCFAVLPVIGALCAGFSLKEVLDFVNKGVGTTWKTAVLFIFSVVYFGVMNDAGMFDRMVNALLKVAGGSLSLLFIATVLIATVGHIDGATASTYLISFPVMLPIFKRLKLNPLVLLLLVASATGIMNMVPWGGPTIRAATAIKGDANALWHSLIPMQIFGLVSSCALALYFAHTEKKRLAASGIDLSNMSAAMAGVESNAQADESLKRPGMYWFNLAFTALLIAALIWTKIPAFVVFMFGCVVALTVNYPDTKVQMQRLTAHAPNCIGLTMTLLCAGVFLGVFANSGMIKEMALVLINVLPDSLRQYLHIIIGVLGAPMGMVMGPDPYYYAVLPLIGETVAPFGVTLEQVAKSMLIGENVALAVSPCVATTFLAIGLVGVELKDHIRFSFKWLWLLSIVMLAFAVVTKIV